jgi:hypothetical protein
LLLVALSGPLFAQELLTYREYFDAEETMLKMEYYYYLGENGARVKHGTLRIWESPGVLSQRSQWKDGKRHGMETLWFSQTGNWTETEYLHGVAYGQSNFYAHCDDGSYTVYRYTYRDGIRHGPATADPTWSTQICQPFGLWSGQYSNGYKCGLWSPPWGGDPSDYGRCDNFEIPENHPYAEIKPDDPLIQKEVRGLVTDRDTGTPIADATVTAQGGNSATTDSKGFYQFTLGTGDSYTISVSKTGYYTRTGTFSLAGVQYKRLNAMLKKAGAQPAITNVSSQYGRIFLEGLTVNNRYTVSVDWNGAEPGVVKFAVNGVVSEVAATGGEVTQSFNMGSAFKAGFGAQTNNLQIVAVTKEGVRSAVEKLHPIVVPLPAWATSLGAFGQIQAENGIVTYKLNKAWPAEAIEIQINEKTLGFLWKAWSLFPLVGGRNFGIPGTQAYLDVEAKTDGSGTVEVGGKTGFQAAGQEIGSKLGGKGTVQYEPGKGLEWKGASLIVGIDGTIKKEVGPVTLIPALEGAVNLGYGVGRTIQWFNSMAKIEGTVKAGANLDLQIVGSDGTIGFKAAEGDMSNGVGVGMAADLAKLKVNVTGGGTNKASWQFPANPGYLKRVEAELSAKIAMDLWLFTKEFSATHTFVHPAEAGAQSLAALPAEPPGFQPVSRDFLNAGPYNLFVPGISVLRSPLNIEGTVRTVQATLGAETPVVVGVYPQSEPAIAAAGGKAALAYVYFDPAKTTLQATDIYFSFDNGAGFPQPAAIRSDTRAEFSPALAFDGEGKVVAVWERVKEANFTGTEIEQMAAQMEIVYAAYNPATAQWTEPVALTDNTWLDHSPMLKQTPDGGLLLVWQSNPGNLLIGDAVTPTTVHYALWNGSGFGAPGTLPGTFENCLTFSLAYRGSGALLAYTRDMDGDLATTADEEIFYNLFDGSAWGGAVRVTDDAVADVNPQVMYRADGAPEMVWRRDAALVRLTDWAAGSYETIRPGSDSATFADFRATIDPDSRLVLYWQGIDPQGIDIFYSVYDVQNASWSGDLRLTRDPDMERDFQGLFSADGIFHLVYNKQNLATGAVALYQLNYALAADAALFAEGLSVAPANPASGMETVLTARVENSGDVALRNLSVAFYLGDPDGGGVLIGTAAAEPALVKAGGSGTASIAWTVPDQPTLYRIYARVVPETAVTEGTLLNNTAFFDAIKTDIEALQCKVEAQGDGTVDITAVIKNSGNIPTGEIEILYRADDRELGVLRLPGILPGKRAEVTHNVWIDTEFTRWQMVFEVEVDPNGTIPELDEKNNSASVLYLPEALFPAGYDFREVAVGTASQAQRFTFTNAIAASILIDAIVGTGPGTAEFALQNDGCSGRTLAGGESCTFDIVFSPATLGVKTASFTVRSGDPADAGAVLAEFALFGGRVIGKGDVDGSGNVDLIDAVLALQMLSGRVLTGVVPDAATDMKGRIGMKEAIAILQHLSELRTLEKPDTSF